MGKIKGYTYISSCSESTNGYKELNMASNDCVDNYLLECNHINYSYGFKFQKYY